MFSLFMKLSLGPRLEMMGESTNRTLGNQNRKNLIHKGHQANTKKNKLSFPIRFVPFRVLRVENVFFLNRATPF